MESMGAVVKAPGAPAQVTWPTILASGVNPSDLARWADITTKAAAPSEMELEFAAVMVPS